MAMESSVETMNCVELSKYLLRNGFGEDVASSFLMRRICGHTFLAMTSTDLINLVPSIQDRVRIRSLLSQMMMIKVISYLAF